MLAVLVVATLMAVIGSLVLGVAAMVNRGTGAPHRTSAHWMTVRVGPLGLALVPALLPLAH